MKKVVVTTLIFFLMFIVSAFAASEFQQRELIHKYINYPQEDWKKLTEANRHLVDENLLKMAKDGMYEMLKRAGEKASTKDDFFSYAFVYANLADYIGKVLNKNEQNRFYVAKLNSQEGRYDRAADICANILLSEPKNVEVMTYQAQLFEFLRMPEEAFNRYNDILKLDKNNKIALYRTGILLLNLARYKDALIRFKALLKVDPNNEVAKKYVEIYEGKVKSNSPVDERKEKAVNHFFLAEKFFNESKFTEAAEEYANAIENDPTFAKAYVYLGATMIKMKKYDEAIKILENAIQIGKQLKEKYPKTSEDPEAYHILGQCYEKEYDYNPDPKLLDNAIENYEKALRVDSNYLKASDDLTRARQKKERLGAQPK